MEHNLKGEHKMDMETKVRGRIWADIFKYVATLELDNGLWEITAYDFEDAMCGVYEIIEKNKCERVRSLKITSEFLGREYMDR
jgi:hypothetical protein